MVQRYKKDVGCRTKDVGLMSNSMYAANRVFRCNHWLG